MPQPKLSHHPILELGYLTWKKKRYYFKGKWPADQSQPPVTIFSQWAAKVTALLKEENDEDIQGSEFHSAHENETEAPPQDLLVCEVVDKFLTWAEGYYKISNEAVSLRYATRDLLELYGETLASKFSPKKLKAVRDRMIERGRTRQGAIKATNIVKRCFRWAGEEELVSASVYESIRLVAPLRRGHTDAPESVRKGRVDDEVVNKTIHHLPRQVAALVKLLQFSGARPSEMCRITTGSIDMSDPACWFYCPSRHKTQNRDAIHERTRQVPLGPTCIEVLRPWLRVDDPDAPLFSPAQRMAELREKLRAKRKSKVQPSQIDRSVSNPEKQPGSAYTTDSLTRLISLVCEQQGIPHWSPGQLRKTHAQRVLKAVSLESARAYLGHSDSEVTRTHYVVEERELAKSAAALVG